MTTKEKVLHILENSPESISGQRLAMKLGKSRCSIWKAVEALRNDGCEIEAVTNRGYRLVRSLDRLDAAAITAKTDCAVTVFDTVTSTNIIAKEQAAQGAPHGTSVIAMHQTNGRGRRGRSFASAGDGIYLSIVLRPNTDYSHAPLITTAAAVAVSDAIAEVCKIECQIKWVNDLFYNGKKICGILTEAVTDIESGAIDSVVVGIGVNFRGKTEDLPEEIQNIAGFLFADKATATRNDLACAIIQNVLRETARLEERTFIESYKNRCFILGKEIEFIYGGKAVLGTAVDVDENCGLKVVLDSCEEILLQAGEVSVRQK